MGEPVFVERPRVVFGLIEKTFAKSAAAGGVPVQAP
jgi:hypothetical protein